MVGRSVLTDAGHYAGARRSGQIELAKIGGTKTVWIKGFTALMSSLIHFRKVRVIAPFDWLSQRALRRTRIFTVHCLRIHLNQMSPRDQYSSSSSSNAYTSDSDSLSTFSSVSTDHTYADVVRNVSRTMSGRDSEPVHNAMAEAPLVHDDFPVCDTHNSGKSRTTRKHKRRRSKSPKRKLFIEHKVKAKVPKECDGSDYSLVETFLAAMKAYVPKSPAKTDADKIALFSNQLTEMAEVWSEEIIHNFGTTRRRLTYETFVQLFEKRFCSPTRVQDAMNELTAMQEPDISVKQHSITFMGRLARYNSMQDNPLHFDNEHTIKKFASSLLPCHIAALRKQDKFRIDTCSIDDIVDYLDLCESNDLAGARLQAMNAGWKQEAVTRKRASSCGSGESGKIPLSQNHSNRGGKSKDKGSKYQKATTSSRPKSGATGGCTQTECKGPHPSDQCWTKFPHLRPSTNSEGKVYTKKFVAMVSECAEDTTTPPELKVTLCGQEVTAVVNSYCSLSLMSSVTAEMLGLNLLTAPTKTRFSLGDGTQELVSDSITEFIRMVVLGDPIPHSKVVQFRVVPRCVSPLILGLDWLHLHNPKINWSKSTVKFKSRYCKRNCLSSPSSDATPSVTSTSSVDFNAMDEFKHEQVTGVFPVSVTLKGGDDNILSTYSGTDFYAVVARGRMPNGKCDIPVRVENGKVLVKKKHLKGFKRSSPEAHNRLVLVGLSKHMVADTSEMATVDFVDANCCALSKVRDPEPLSQEELMQLPACYHELQSVFSKVESERLPTHRPYDISIKLSEGSEPKWGPIYNLSVDEMSVLKGYIEDNLAKGFIQPSSSPCSSPVLFVTKKDGTLRLCVDYRSLNEITEKDRYPLPLIDSLLDRLRGAKIFTALDLRGAYNLVRVKAGDEWKTAFRSRYGHFEYLVMPFGLTNAPAVFQRLMDDLLRQYLDVFVVVYLDDILIYSEDLATHQQHVRKVLQVLLDNDLYCKFSKCEFHVDHVEFLGYVVSPNGIEMNTKKIQSILEWEPPTSVTGVLSFVGFANFYRRFIRNFSKVVQPLTALTKKSVQFEWTVTAQNAFDSLKHLFITAPVLVYADTTRQFIIETDASAYALGCVLSQFKDDGLLHPCAFYSKKFTPTETNWQIHDKELYAIVVAFKQWRQYLKGAPHDVLVYSDHNNLKYFMSKNLVSDKQIRWSLFLSEFRFVINYRPGTQMGKADALSRQESMQDSPASKQNYATLIPQGQVGDYRLSGKPELVTLAAIVSRSPRQDLVELVSRRTAMSELWKSLRVASDPELESQYTIRGNLIYDVHHCIVIPDDDMCKLAAVQLAHDHPSSGHLGVKATISLLRREYTFTGLEAYVKSFVSSCDICQRSKIRRHLPYGLLQPLSIPSKPWIEISMDFVGPLPTSDGFDMILVVVDRLTKMAHFIPTHSSLKSKDLMVLFRANVFWLHGVPAGIISDRGSLFTSAFWRHFLTVLGVDIKLSTAHHQQTNGQSERVIQTLKGYLRRYINYNQDDWASYLPSAEFAYNNCTHSSTKISPFMANFGYDFGLGGSHVESTGSSTFEGGRQASHMKKIHSDLQEMLVATQAEVKKYADRLRRDMPKFVVGASVWLQTTFMLSDRKSKSLDYKYIGPLEIVGQVNKLAFRLKLPSSMSQMHDVFHVSLLEPYIANAIPDRHVPPPPPMLMTSVDGSSAEEYEIEEIVASRIRYNRTEYLVHWKGYSIVDRQWIAASELPNCQQLVDEFLARQALSETKELRVRGSKQKSGNPTTLRRRSKRYKTT